MFGRKNKNQPQARRPYDTAARSPVYSYYSSRSPREGAARGEQADREKELKKLSLLQRLPGVISAAVLLVAASYLFVLSAHARLVFTGDNVPLRQAAAYQAYADELLRASPANRLKLTLDSDGISTKMQRRFPELQSVSVTVPLVAHRPVFRLGAARPAFVLQSESERYYISQDGRAIIAFNDVAEPVKDTVTAIDRSGIPVRLGTQALPGGLVAFTGEVIAQLKAADIPIKEIILPAAPNEIHLYVNGKPYYVKFNTLGKPREQAGTFLAVKEKLDRERVGVSEYIDVRVEERAYYR